MIYLFHFYFVLLATTPGLPAKKAITPAIKVKNLQWMKIPNNKVKETFWGEMLNDDERLLSKLSLQEIETTFAAKAAKVEEPVGKYLY